MNRTFYYILIVVFISSGCGDRYINIIPYDNDHFQEACDITAEINEGYPELNYQGTTRATPDKKAGSCWGTDKPNHNVWFKFKATSTGDVSIIVSLDLNNSAYQKRTLIALWEKDGITELSCSKFINETDDVTLNYTGLTEGEWYYFSIDVYDSESRGTFYLRVYDYY